MAPFSRASMASNAAFMGVRIWSRKPVVKLIRDTSSVKPTDGRMHRYFLYRSHNSRWLMIPSHPRFPPGVLAPRPYRGKEGERLGSTGQALRLTFNTRLLNTVSFERKVQPLEARAASATCSSFAS